MKNYDEIWHEGKEIPVPEDEPYQHRSRSYTVIVEGKTEPETLPAWYWFPTRCWVYAGTQVPVKVKTWIERYWR